MSQVCIFEAAVHDPLCPCDFSMPLLIVASAFCAELGASVLSPLYFWLQNILIDHVCCLLEMPEAAICILASVFIFEMHLLITMCALCLVQDALVDHHVYIMYCM